MEHRGIQYQVVQAASPPVRFRWTVQLTAEETKAGVAPTRDHAIFELLRVIDSALGIGKTRKN